MTTKTTYQSEQLEHFGTRKKFCLILVICWLLPSFEKCMAVEESLQYYKMLSSVEYAGKSQFRNQSETLFTVKKQFLSDSKALYFISGRDDSGNLSTGMTTSFLVDKQTRHMSNYNGDMAFLETLTNHCVDSVKNVTKHNIGKNWEQKFNLSSIDSSFPNQFKFGLSAIKLKTTLYGNIIAVRAMSESFTVKVNGVKAAGNAEGKLNAVYLFDPEIENIYLSITVFEATTTVNGSKEVLRHELATYQTDAEGTSINLNGLGKDFERFVRKVGLTNQTVKIDKKSNLPQWVTSDGLRVAQISNVCAAIACEGALNPVVTICVPAARTVAMQGAGKIGTAGVDTTVGGLLAKNLAGVGAMKIAVAPAIIGAAGVNGTTLLAGGGAAAGGAVAVGAGGGGGGSSSSDIASP